MVVRVRRAAPTSKPTKRTPSELDYQTQNLQPTLARLAVPAAGASSLRRLSEAFGRFFWLPVALELEAATRFPFRVTAIPPRR